MKGVPTSRTRQALSELVAGLLEAPTPLRIAKSLKSFASMAPEEAGFQPLKVGVVSSFTFDPLVNPLKASGYCAGFRLQVYNAPYGQFIQELINPASGLHAFSPDVVLIAVRLQDACPTLYDGFNKLDSKGVQALKSHWQDDLSRTVETFRTLSDARIFCVNYEQPAYPSLGLADQWADPSQAATIAALNAWLNELQGMVRNFHVLDVDALAARCGRDRWTDPKSWFWARLPIASPHHWDYVREITRMLRVTAGKAKKVLALDCDNTLWGGVLGEVGPQGIALGHDFPGNAFVAFQKRVLELHHRGVVLVIASKNERATVVDVFENHPDMVLRPEHVAYFGVNWKPKPENLRHAADALNLGIDSFVFLDDHPVECAMVRSVLPEVITVQLPQDPAEYERTLTRLDWFDQLTISFEDRARGKLYRAEAQRSVLRGKTTNLESFYRDLEMKVLVACNSPATVGRAAQLSQRTNQFNMTTRRRTESEIEGLMANDSYEVFTIRLVDRFGDAGIVGLAIVEHNGAADALETFLMSCRVLGRTVEQTFLAWIGRQALEGERSKIVGVYRPTPKNAPFADFYQSVGMRLEETDRDGVQRWSCDLSPAAPVLTLPAWIKVETA